MADDISITWKVTNLDCYPDFSGLYKDFVFNVHWDCLSAYSGVSGLYNGRIYSTTCVSTELISGYVYTPYADLTEAQVLNWVWGIFPSGQKEVYEESVTQQIYNQINPPIVQPPLPWTVSSP